MATQSLRMFRQGHCDAMAVALHDRYGYPLGVWRGFFPDDMGDEGDEAFEDAHMCVILPDGSWADVDGVHHGKPENLIFDNPIVRVELVEISREEANYIFGEISDEAISIAQDHLPDLDM